MGTARQVDLLRTEIGNGFTELRTNSDTLRTELLKAITDGLREHRDEIITALTREQQEAKLAHRDNRELQRQLAEARDELHQIQLLAVQTESPAALVEAVHPELVESAVADEPAEGVFPAPPVIEPLPVETLAAGPAPVYLPVKETTVSETVPAEENHSPETGITGDQARQLIELLSRLAPATVPDQEQPTASQAAADPTPGEAGGVTDLIPAALAWPTHVATLLKAAAVNTVAISCNPHTWDFLNKRVEGAEHFDKQDAAQRPRGSAQEHQGDNVLSGRSVIALLNALRSAVYAGTGQEVETWALAVTCYERIAQVINATRPAADEQQQQQLTQPRIVLDDLSVKSAA
ncbi:hypothetical protein [Kitasatospora sp. McL0602]|uniref:hypothetical protein n=1 Tax=Kitasatospora sp. McL0602 TaxID=3439530 RepID=UPI003F8958FB